MTIDVPAPVSTARLWTGRILGYLPAAMLLFGGVANISKLDFIVQETIKNGFNPDTMVPLGIVTVISALLYLIPKTEVIGAILITGYMGGAVAVHYLMKNDPLPQVLTPAIFAAVIWLGLVLRNDRVMALMPWRR
ncbi:MAG: DoxX family protein [Pirellulales bacterium]